MNKIFIFSGTTEGRLLSEFLCDKGIEHKVFVATDYGQVVMKDHPLCHVLQGRLAMDDMTALFKKEKPDMVVDATHPFAIEVSKNIKEACKQADMENAYLRLSRPIGDIAQNSSVKIVPSTEEAITYLKNRPGNILLTTGVKTLPDYAAVDELKERLYARILPSLESFTRAVDTGLARRQIIAMEGPFTQRMNEATIEQYDIAILVTKNSGSRGGIVEKISACQAKGIEALIIDLDAQYKNDGLGLDEVKRKLCQQQKQLSIVGIGMGNDASVTVTGKETIASANLLIGAKRMLDYGASINSQARRVAEYRPEAIADAIENALEENIAVLMSGDTGFYSGADKLTVLLKERGIDYKLYPGISSISYFCSRIGKSYSSYPQLSAHGKELTIDENTMQQGGFFAILSNAEDIAMILGQLQAWQEAKVYVGYNLGQGNEKIDSFKLAEAHEFTQPGLYLMGVFLDD